MKSNPAPVIVDAPVNTVNQEATMQAVANLCESIRQDPWLARLIAVCAHCELTGFKPKKQGAIALGKVLGYVAVLAFKYDGGKIAFDDVLDDSDKSSNDSEEGPGHFPGMSTL